MNNSTLNPYEILMGRLRRLEKARKRIAISLDTLHTHITVLHMGYSKAEVVRPAEDRQARLKNLLARIDDRMATLQVQHE